MWPSGDMDMGRSSRHHASPKHSGTDKRSHRRKELLELNSTLALSSPTLMGDGQTKKLSFEYRSSGSIIIINLQLTVLDFCWTKICLFLFVYKAKIERHFVSRENGYFGFMTCVYLIQYTVPTPILGSGCLLLSWAAMAFTGPWLAHFKKSATKCPAQDRRRDCKSDAISWILWKVALWGRTVS